MYDQNVYGGRGGGWGGGSSERCLKWGGGGHRGSFQNILKQGWDIGLWIFFQIGSKFKYLS